MRKNSIKNVRINAEVQRELSNIIRNEVKDPRIHMLTSVVSVIVAPDLKTCKAYISVLGSTEEGEATVAGLKNAEGFIRSQLAKNLNLRNTPQIHPGSVDRVRCKYDKKDRRAGGGRAS